MAGTCPDQSDPNMQWPYCPSYSAAIAFTALFGILTTAHLIQAIYYSKKFCWVICMASAWETTGFVFRILGAHDPTVQTYNIASNILILLAPLWVNAFAYMLMGRIAYYWHPEKRLWKIKARTLTVWFVWLDVITFLVQGGGGSLLNNTDPNITQIGTDVYMAGIGLQQFFLLIFLVLMISFHLSVWHIGVLRPTPWAPQLYALYTVLVLISTRIIFRLVEFSNGLNGPIPTHEAYFYALEATPLFLAITILAILHPGRSLITRESEFSKLVSVKGQKRWWCCGRRLRTKTDPDFELGDREGGRLGSGDDA